MEDAQASKREGRGEKRKQNKDEGPSKKPKMDLKDKKPVWQRVNMEKARGTGSYQKYDTDKDKNVKNPSPESPVKDMPRPSWMGKAMVNDPPSKGVIRIIVCGPPGGDSQRTRKSQDTGNDALVITALLADYEIERVFIDSGSSADILFGEAYDQMRLGDVPLKAVDTSLYGIAGGVIYPRGMISLPLTLGTSPLRKTCLLKFLVVDIPSAYKIILGCPTLNAFRAVISTYHMKIKFPVIRGVSEAQADALQACKFYVEAIKRGKKRILDEASGEEISNK
ncbi:UNVERIFIED_CONTAM: hypothetical protein Slati_2264000 [Sesamum latifolium]|uniref:Peptidase A2 domain-containing protein n=1 Tax=Sesamum latifolium TaxID=2727402 RepID=A0AAW2WVH1_9LAMI